MGWTVQGSNPGSGEILRTRPHRSYGTPTFLYNGYRVSFPGVKRPGRGVNHPLPAIVEVKKPVQLHLHSPSGNAWPIPEWRVSFIFY